MIDLTAMTAHGASASKHDRRAGLARAPATTGPAGTYPGPGCAGRSSPRRTRPGPPVQYPHRGKGERNGKRRERYETGAGTSVEGVAVGRHGRQRGGVPVEIQVATQCIERVAVGE